MSKFIIRTLLLIFVVFTAQVLSDCPNAKSHLKSSLPSTTKGKYSFFTWGVDLFTSNALTAANIKCLENSGRYSTIGLFLGMGTFVAPPFNPTAYSTDTLKAFFASSLKKEIVLNVNFNETSESKISSYVQTQLAPFLSSKSQINRVWIRPNIDPNCPRDSNYLNCQVLNVTSNFAILNISLAAVSKLGFQTGVYLNIGIWIVGFEITQKRFSRKALRDLIDHPLMFDDNDYNQIEPSYAHYEQIGPWTTPGSKMSGYWYIDSTCCWPGQVGWTKNDNGLLQETKPNN